MCRRTSLAPARSIPVQDATFAYSAVMSVAASVSVRIPAAGAAGSKLLIAEAPTGKGSAWLGTDESKFHLPRHSAYTGRNQYLTG